MKTLLITLPIFLVLNACGKSDDDTGAADESFVTNNGMSAEDDGGGDDGGGDDGGGSADGGGDDGGFEVMNSSPGCIATGALCYSYVGPLWPGYEASHCDQISAAVQAEGGPALEYIATGCPAGASSECSGILGLMDQEENLLDGSEYSIYFYGGADASAECGQAGGTYSAL